jgi:hypothetical protein
MIGSTVNPALGRIDYSPIVQGAQSAAQSIQNAGQAAGQMYSNLGKQISGGFEQYQKNKEERDFYETAVRSKMGEAIQSMNQFKANPGLYNNKAPIRPEMLESISVEDIPKISIGKLKAYTNELDGILQKSRGALAEANAIRQYEKDIQATQNDKFLGKALMSTQGLKVQDGVSTRSIKRDFGAPIEGLKALNYGESVKRGKVTSALSLPSVKPADYSTIPDSVKNFLVINSVTGAAELNKEEVEKFNSYSEKVLADKASYRYNVERGTLPKVKIERFGGRDEFGVPSPGTSRVIEIEMPMNSKEKIAANNVYKESLQSLAQMQETKKALDQAEQIAKGEAQGASPAEIKTLISSDPNLTTLQSSAFKYVTKPEFRDATGAEKADKVVSEYLKQGGELGFDFLSKVKAAFKADVEMQDLGGGMGFVRVGNNVNFFNKGDVKTPSAAMFKLMDNKQYQSTLTYSASFPTWESVPQVIKQALSEAGAIHNPGEGVLQVSAIEAWGRRRSELTGGQVSVPPNMLVKPAAAPPIGFTPTQPVR